MNVILLVYVASGFNVRVASHPTDKEPLGHRAHTADDGQFNAEVDLPKDCQFPSTWDTCQVWTCKNRFTNVGAGVNSTTYTVSKGRDIGGHKSEMVDQKQETLYTGSGYPNGIPASGFHRPKWPAYGEYRYVPPLRYVHALEHGAIVFMYHPCTPENLIQKFRALARGCLWKHLFFSFRGDLSADYPMALVAYGKILKINDINSENVHELRNWIKSRALVGASHEGRVFGNGAYDLLLLHSADIVTEIEDKVICPGDDVLSPKLYTYKSEESFDTETNILPVGNVTSSEDQKIMVVPSPTSTSSKTSTTTSTTTTTTPTTTKQVAAEKPESNSTTSTPVKSVTYIATPAITTPTTTTTATTTTTSLETKTTTTTTLPPIQTKLPSTSQTPATNEGKMLETYPSPTPVPTLVPTPVPTPVPTSVPTPVPTNSTEDLLITIAISRKTQSHESFWAFLSCSVLIIGLCYTAFKFQLCRKKRGYSRYKKNWGDDEEEQSISIKKLMKHMRRNSASAEVTYSLLKNAEDTL